MPLTAAPAGAGLSHLTAGLDLLSRTALTHEHPGYHIDHIVIDGRPVPVTEEVAATSPFCTLLRFRKPSIAGQPKVLVVAPLSGHFATLLRGTVERMLPFADVYITDWRDARNVPLADGQFDLDDYIDYVIEFLAKIGGEGDPRPHVLAVCQPSVPVYAAVALMNAMDQALGAASFATAHPADRIRRDLGFYIRQANPDGLALGAMARILQSPALRDRWIG
jgi:polyhydroxyalkanoate depolymerase